MAIERVLTVLRRVAEVKDDGVQRAITGAQSFLNKFLTDCAGSSLNLRSGGNSGVVGQLDRRPRLHF